MTKITAKDVINEFELSVANREAADLDRPINQPSISRAGLELSGAYTVLVQASETAHFENNIIGWGTKERKWFEKLSKPEGIKALKNALTLKTPLIILSSGMHGAPVDWVLEVASEYKIPVVNSNMHLAVVISMIGPWIALQLTETLDLHGSLVSIYGYGVMIIGPSGIGKSEAVLELIQDNHLFVSDDTVVVAQLGNQFIGRSAPITQGYLEARGIGIIDVGHMFGAQIMMEQTNIDLVVELVPGEKMDELDRLGNQLLYYKVLNGKLPLIQIPVNQGRSTATLIKAAAASFIAKKHGKDPLGEIQKRGME